VGAVPAVVIGGAITIAVTLIAAWRVPEIARLDRLEGHDPDAADPVAASAAKAAPSS